MVVGAAIGAEKRGMAGGRGGTGAGVGAAGALGAGAGGAGAAGGGGGATGRAAAGTATGEEAGEGEVAPALGFTGKTALHTAQRARTPPTGTLAGSTRYTVSHDGQVTFISRGPPPLPPPRPSSLHPRPAPNRAGDRPRTPIPAVSSRSSSSPSRAHSLARGGRTGGAGS